MEIYIDGQFVPETEAKVSVFDHGFLYGDGVFEGIRSYNGKIFRLMDHIDRLYDSAKTIDMAVPVSKEEFADIIIETVRRNGLQDGYIRPIVTRGTGTMGLDPRKCPNPTIICIAIEWGAMYGDLYEKGLTAVTVAVRRNSPDALPPNVKSLNYLNNILAKIEANYKGGDEAIFFDAQGRISEGSGDNIFIVKNGTIYTPYTLTNLKGITRQVLIEIVETLGIPLREVELGFYDLYTADEIIVTGTAAEIAPIVTVDGRSIGSGRPGPITKQIMAAFKTITEQEGTPVY